VEALGKMTRQQVVDRARSAVGRQTVYVLGAGGRMPGLQRPDAELDCSGFAAWATGIDRYLPNDGIKHRPGKEWFECSNIFEDARSTSFIGSQVSFPEALPGDVLVWPDGDGHQGHIGVVASCEAGFGPSTIVHCSAGNFRHTGDAIQETDTSLFTHHGAIAVRLAWVEG